MGPVQLFAELHSGCVNSAVLLATAAGTRFCKRKGNKAASKSWQWGQVDERGGSDSAGSAFALLNVCLLEKNNNT